jgi:hypothetical protein
MYYLTSQNNPRIINLVYFEESVGSKYLVKEWKGQPFKIAVGFVEAGSK